MTMPRLPVPATNFMNVQVTVLVKPGGGPEQYEVSCDPHEVIVTARDTVINYQLIEPTPRDIVFAGVTVKPVHNDQLSKAVISVSKKLLTLSDAGTIHETMFLTLDFRDQKGTPISFDPQVINRPE